MKKTIKEHSENKDDIIKKLEDTIFKLKQKNMVLEKKVYRLEKKNFDLTKKYNSIKSTTLEEVVKELETDEE